MAFKAAIIVGITIGLVSFFGIRKIISDHQLPAGG